MTKWWEDNIIYPLCAAFI